MVNADAGGRVDADGVNSDGIDADGVGAGGDGDGAGDGGDLKGGNWWDPCTFDYRHGNLGQSHFFTWNNIAFSTRFIQTEPIKIFFQITLLGFSKHNYNVGGKKMRKWVAGVHTRELWVEKAE